MTFIARTLATASVLALAAAAPAFAARNDRDFTAGQNAEQQACRAMARFDGGRDVSAVDLYCGPWERPSGFVAAYPAAAEAKALERLREQCAGEGSPIASSGLGELRQIACERKGEGPRRFGLLARQGNRIVVGVAYPADWAPMVSATRVLTGLDRPGQAASGDAPGMRELQAAYPGGVPGQGAAINHELLRRRAYEHNAVWSFSSAQRDFSELLRSHEQVAPDDDRGAAEILAEIGVNLSGERRFEEAADAFDQAEARATRAGDRLLLSKIGNYRAIDALNQGQRAKARELALAANAARDQLFAGGGNGGATRLTADEARAIEDDAAARAGRGLLMSMGELTDREKAAVLSAQAEYLAGVAARGMGDRAEASAHLAQATRRLSASPVQPGWLVGLIYNERSRLAAAAGDAGAAAREAQEGLALLRRDSPGTRAEGHLLLTLAEAKRLGGDAQGALADSRAAVTLFSAHRESPGMPADVASAHLSALHQAWSAGSDPALADEYFQTLTMVWDGAAARSAAQLAARLAVSEGGDAVRDYQDAQRGYRAALARRERLSTSREADRSLIEQADAEVSAAAGKLADTEATLRSQSPRYVELLSPKLKSADLSAALEDGEGYLRLVVADDRVYGALVTREGVRPYLIDMDAREAKALSDKVRNSVLLRRGRLPDYDIASATTLYAKLFAPIQGELDGLQRLQIDAGGPLAGVPFAALVAKAPDEATLKRVRADQDYRGIEWFGRSKAIAAALGPAAFVRIRRNPNEGAASAAVTFGDFQPNPALVAERIAARQGLSERCRKELEAVLTRLEALPDTLQEAQLTAAAFGERGRAVTQASFTDAAVLKDPAVADASVLVLATHGVLGLSNCFAEPALLASTGPDGDGLIEASELLDVKLKARLVVMSACDTAGGGRSDAARSGFADGGEALSGLARAFIYAGANSVLATHWKIDASTSSLQTQALLTNAVQSGKPLSVALADAQKALYEKPETAHPFYWSGFVLIGDGNTRLAADEKKAAGAGTTAD